eukprot:121817_1
MITLEEHDTLIQKYEETKSQLNGLMKHCQQKEQALKETTSKYRQIIPEFICSRAGRKLPGDRIQYRVLQCIKHLLFDHSKYCYSFSNVMKLFNDLVIFMQKSSMSNNLNIINDKITVESCLYTAKAIDNFFSRTGTGNRKPIAERQQMQTVATSAIYIHPRTQKLMNRDFMHEVIPQTQSRNRNKFISGCFSRRLSFDRRECRIICKKYSETRTPRIPMLIKKTIPEMVIRMSKRHPSLLRVEKNIYGKIVYSQGLKKNKLPVMMYTQTKKWLHKRWLKETVELREKHYEGKDVSCSEFKKYIPNHCVHRSYIKLMACDSCELFNWKRDSVDRILKEYHNCTKNDDCTVCSLLEIDSFDLLLEMCCKHDIPDKFKELNLWQYDMHWTTKRTIISILLGHIKRQVQSNVVQDIFLCIQTLETDEINEKKEIFFRITWRPNNKRSWQVIKKTKRIKRKRDEI